MKDQQASVPEDGGAFVELGKLSHDLVTSFYDKEKNCPEVDIYLELSVICLYQYY